MCLVLSEDPAAPRGHGHSTASAPGTGPDHAALVQRLRDAAGAADRGHLSDVAELLTAAAQCIEHQDNRLADASLAAAAADHLVGCLQHELGLARERTYRCDAPKLVAPDAGAGAAHWSQRMLRDARSAGPF